jgi:hypothetical protein
MVALRALVRWSQWDRASGAAPAPLGGEEYFRYRKQFAVASTDAKLEVLKGTAHGLRAGRATQARNAGMGESEMCGRGHWASPTSLHSYMDEILALNAAQRLAPATRYRLQHELEELFSYIPELRWGLLDEDPAEVIAGCFREVGRIVPKEWGQNDRTYGAGPVVVTHSMGMRYLDATAVLR